MTLDEVYRMNLEAGKWIEISYNEGSFKERKLLAHSKPYPCAVELLHVVLIASPALLKTHGVPGDHLQMTLARYRTAHPNLYR